MFGVCTEVVLLGVAKEGGRGGGSMRFPLECPQLVSRALAAVAAASSQVFSEGKYALLLAGETTEGVRGVRVQKTHDRDVVKHRTT